MKSIDDLMEKLADARQTAREKLPDKKLLSIYRRGVSSTIKPILYITGLGNVLTRSGNEFWKKDISSSKKVKDLYDYLKMNKTTAEAIKDLTYKIRNAVKDYSPST